MKDWIKEFSIMLIGAFIACLVLIWFLTFFGILLVFIIYYTYGMFAGIIATLINTAIAITILNDDTNTFKTKKD